MIEIQDKFTGLIGILINKVHNFGYRLTFGEAWRPPEMAKIYAEEGKGIVKSLHTERLAVDFNAFLGDEYLDGSKPEHIPHLLKLGELWESLDPNCTWGGRFAMKDYNHYSYQHYGIK